MIDGVFVRFLVQELKKLENVRINKVNTLNAHEFYLLLSAKNKLLINTNSENMHLRFTNMELVNSPLKINFHQTLKRYLESSIITSISQHNNDRIMVISINHFDDLGYIKPIKLIFEFFGRNANAILVDENDVIIDSSKRLFENSDPSLRIILPKAKYIYPEQTRINPYQTNDLKLDENIYEGVSSFLFSEIVNNGNFDILYSEIKPVIIKEGKKNHFYCFDLPSIKGERLYFDTLSEMLEYFYLDIKKDQSLNSELSFIKSYVNKEIIKLNTKIAKLNNDLNIAKENLKLEETGNLLASNLHLVKKGDEKIIVKNFYDNNKEFIIALNPLLSPKKNLENIFNKYQKAKRGINQINIQIELSENDINYYKCLLNQLDMAKALDIYEIYQELGLKDNLIKKQAKKTRPNITTFKTKDGITIYVGKNNIQNNYITHTLATKNDYFFHVQGNPGSHIIVKTNNLTDELKELAGVIAACFSPAKNSTNVCVDYTQVKNLKKVPGMKGSFVTYTSYKSIFVKPDLNYIKEKTTN